MKVGSAAAAPRAAGRVAASDTKGAPGALVVVPTPLGHPDDLSVRALRVLRDAERIAAEDTRVTRALLRHHGIEPRSLVSCHDHNESERAEQIVRWIREGATVALVSDAGTPLVSDPGFRVVRAVLAAELPLEVLPGPCAAITALLGSGLPVDRFLFVGFLPRDAGPRRAVLDELEEQAATLVFYESPLRLGPTLEALAERWPERSVCVARNLTKVHEQWLRGTAAECRATLGDETRGEVVLLVGGATERAPPSEADLDAAIDALLAAGRPAREARDALAERFRIPKRTVYQRILARSAGETPGATVR